LETSRGAFAYPPFPRNLIPPFIDFSRRETGGRKARYVGDEPVTNNVRIQKAYIFGFSIFIREEIIAARNMRYELIDFEEFLGDFKACVLSHASGTCPYSLVLGAGASHSAGIPLAGQMVLALKKLARVRNIRADKPPPGGGDLSWWFRRVLRTLDRVKTGHDDGFVKSGREFLMTCIRRAEREANLTHLIAAHLATAGIVNPIITTNFDDLALAAFWNLPWTDAYDEPHIIYDARSVALSDPKIAEYVPMVIKAHGHHTTYGLGILKTQIGALAPYVKQVIKSFAQPTEGYVIVGYSGDWDDGVMQALCDPTITRGRTVFWLFRGTEVPENKYIKRLSLRTRLKFVPIVDSDLAFLYLWASIPDDEYFSVRKMLYTEHLFSFPAGRISRDRTWDLQPYGWLNPNLVSRRSGEWTWQNQEKLLQVRKQLLPVLGRFEHLDQKYLVSSCIHGPGYRFKRHESAEMDQMDEQISALEKLVPVSIPWTRRNRTILKYGISPESDIQIASMLLGGLLSLGQ
jgi:hypothetical protein